MNRNNTLEIFRKIAKVEGISFLILLFIAMPLKYMGGILLPVKIIGWIHGGLFIAYIIALSIVAINNRWSFIKILIAFIASLFPFATFWLDSRIERSGNNFI